jgi:molybdenum cofactor cytidylyltransferase
MIAVDSVAVVLLAAGVSNRFGPRDKLTEPLDGLPLAFHAARTLGSLPFAVRIVVSRDGGPDFTRYGFTPVHNSDPSAGQSGSIRLAIARARLARPGAVLIALADMPFVPFAHFEALLGQFDETRPIVASIAGSAPGPPALFGAHLFDALEGLRGDEGAKALLRDAILVTAPVGALVDIDTMDDLAAATVRARAL